MGGSSAGRAGTPPPLYLLTPDYTKLLPGLPPRLEQRIQERVIRLYGEIEADAITNEIDRLVRVHNAHKSAELEAWEQDFDPRERFSEKDVILITYGDLILSESRPPLRTLADFAEVFFRGLITTLHVLPFYPYSSDRGFSVIDYRAVDPRLGSWDDVATLKKSFKLMFDGVFNHVSSQSRWFEEFLAGNPEERDTFIAFSRGLAIDDDRLKLVLRPRTSSLLTRFETLRGPRFVWTTFSPDQIDLNFHNPKVLLRILDILLYYVRHGADLVRLDAITYIWAELGTSCAHLEQTHEVVRLFRDVLDAAARDVALVTETNVPHKENITYFGTGDDEAQMVYNFALPPLVLHTFLTGNAEVLSRWAAGLEPPSETTAFFNFLDSHDGIGLLGARGILSSEEIDAICAITRGRGGFVSMRTDSDGSSSPYELNITWFSALNPEDAGEPRDLQIDRFIASRAVALALRGVPGIYLPSLIGSKNDLDAVMETGSKRSINRTRIHEDRLFAAFLSNPESTGYRIARRYLDMIERRVAEPCFHPAAPQRVVPIDDRVFSLLRISRDGSRWVWCLVNVTPEPLELDLPLAEQGLGRPLDDMLTSRPADGRIHLDPYQVAWLRSAG
ncbi:MAG: sugar phosphorylase [Acidobacteriota bacterium]|nr:sugar phosphorylase [Acidobacteriota bacterium]